MDGTAGSICKSFIRPLILSLIWTQLEDLFVTEKSRNLGLGKALFAELAQIAQDNNCARMDWAVLTWNTPSIDFYVKVLGAKAMDGWQGMRLEEAGIESLKKFRLM